MSGASDTKSGTTISTWGRFTEDGVEYQRWSVRSSHARFFIDLPSEVETWKALCHACAAVRDMEYIDPKDAV